MSRPSTISTNGWDTVFATNYTNINSQIQAQWKALSTQAPTLSTISATMQDGKMTASVDLTMSAWSLTQGASGGLVRMQLPISSGTYSGIINNYDLTGQTITIELGLEWVPQPNQINFTISTNLDAVEADLGAAGGVVTDNIVGAFASGGVKLAESSTITIITADICWKITDPVSTNSYYLYVTDVEGSDSLIEVYQYINNSLSIAPPSPIAPVIVIQAGNIKDPIDGPIFKELIAGNIDQNLKEFNFVFASADVVTQLSKDDVWAWLQPTSIEYAVVEPARNPTNDNCVFAILAMVNNNVNPRPVLQVDVNAIDPYASHSLLISPTMFLTNMLARGVSAVFDGSTSKDFNIDLDNLSITNNTKLTWGSFKLDSGDTITLTIEAEDFAISLENDRITVNFSNLNYPMDGLFGIDFGSMDIIFSGQYQLGLKEGGNGNKTLWFDVPADQQPITNVSTVMSEAYYTTEKVFGIITICLSIIALGGAAGSKIATNAAKNAVIDAGEVSANATTAEVQAAFKALLEDSEGAFANAASEDALATLKFGLNSIKTANVWGTVAKVCTGLAALTGLGEGTMQLYEAILEDASQEKWENTPSFGNFASLAIERYSFGAESPALLDVDLAESLQISFVTGPAGVGGKEDTKPTKPTKPTEKPTDPKKEKPEDPKEKPTDPKKKPEDPKKPEYPKKEPKRE